MRPFLVWLGTRGVLNKRGDQNALSDLLEGNEKQFPFVSLESRHLVSASFELAAREEWPTSIELFSIIHWSCCPPVFGGLPRLLLHPQPPASNFHPLHALVCPV